MNKEIRGGIRGGETKFQADKFCRNFIMEENILLMAVAKKIVEIFACPPKIMRRLTDQPINGRTIFPRAWPLN